MYPLKQLAKRIYNSIITVPYRYLPRYRNIVLPAYSEDTIIKELQQQTGITVEPIRIDKSGFQNFLAEHNHILKKNIDNFVEKYFEYFVSLILLNLKPDDILIDIASRRSPFPEVVRERNGCMVYRQDLIYDQGIDGERIGGNAGAMPVPDNFCSAMTLHCSFEHFAGKDDSNFIIEAGRVLKPGGKVCILPLYIKDEPCIFVDPCISTPDVSSETGFRIVPRLGTRIPFARHYNVSLLKQRVLDVSPNLISRIFLIQNSEEIDPSIYLRFALVLEKK